MYIERADTDELGIACVLIAVWNGPLEWHEVIVIDFQVILTVLTDSLFLSETNTAVLEGSEDGRRHIHIVALHRQTQRDRHTDTDTQTDRETHRQLTDIRRLWFTRTCQDLS